MRTRRSTPSVSPAFPARDLFESSALYELVSQLGVHAYEDLLSPHWMVPDRASCRESLARDRFTRRRSRAAARAALALHADRAPGSRRDLRHGSLLAGLEAGDTPAQKPDPSGTAGAAREPRSLLEFFRDAFGACVAWLMRLSRLHR